MANPEETSRKDILLEAYRTRVELLVTQGNRLWTRFNYFLAIEVALGALYYIHHVKLAAFVGLVFSFFWYLIAANDHYFLEHGRERAKLFEKEYLIPLAGEPLFEALYTEGIKIKWSLIRFDIKPLRVTRWSVYMPVICCFFWVFSLFVPLHDKPVS